MTNSPSSQTLLYTFCFASDIIADAVYCWQERELAAYCLSVPFKVTHAHCSSNTAASPWHSPSSWLTTLSLIVNDRYAEAVLFLRRKLEFSFTLSNSHCKGISLLNAAGLSKALVHNTLSSSRDILMTSVKNPFPCNRAPRHFSRWGLGARKRWLWRHHGGLDWLDSWIFTNPTLLLFSKVFTSWFLTKYVQ